MDRMMIMLMPAKYQPDYLYLRHVRIKRVHIFTLLQILCLASLWVIKAIKTISIVFPVMVLGTCFVRKGMEKFFTKNELTWLDEAKPEQEDREVFEDDIDNDVSLLHGATKKNGIKKSLIYILNCFKKSIILNEATNTTKICSAEQMAYTISTKL